VILVVGLGPQSIFCLPGPMRKLWAPRGANANRAGLQTRSPGLAGSLENGSLISGKHGGGTASFPPSTLMDYCALFSMKPLSANTHTLSLLGDEKCFFWGFSVKQDLMDRLESLCVNVWSIFEHNCITWEFCSKSGLLLWMQFELNLSGSRIRCGLSCRRKQQSFMF